MAILTIGTIFVAGTLAKSSEVNGNFNNITAWSTTLDYDNFQTISGALNFTATTAKALNITNNGTFTSILLTNNSNARSLDIVNNAQLLAGNATILITDSVAQVTATSAELKMVLSASATIPAIDILHGANTTFQVKSTHLVVPSKTTAERDAIVAAPVASVLFNSTVQELQFNTSSGWAQSVPTGSVQTFAGFIFPTGWLSCDGTAVSRTTYAALLAVLSKSSTGNTHTSTLIDNIPAGGTTNVVAGWYISGPGIQAGTTVTVVGATSLTLSLATTASTNGVAFTAAPYGIGDGTTTFNVPDMRRRVVMGSGGTGTATVGNLLGNIGGAETHQLIQAELASHSHGVTAPVYYGSVDSGQPANARGWSRDQGIYPDQTVTSTTIGSNTAHNNIQPAIILNYIIKT